MCIDPIVRETVEFPKEITTHYIETRTMIEEIVKKAEKEYELIYAKKEILKEIKRIERITGKDLDKLKKKVIEQTELTLEVLRRVGVAGEHIMGYLIQVWEIRRNAFIGKAVLKYLRRLQEEVNTTWVWEHEKIKTLMDEYNAVLDTLKKRFKLIDIPCKEAAYEIDTIAAMLGLQIPDWNKTLNALRTKIRCLVDFIESIIESLEEEEILHEEVREVATP